MYKIVIYHDENGNSEFEDYYLELNKKSLTSKDARIQYNIISRYIKYLERYGTRELPKDYAKQITGDIWELRPDRHRILYFYYKDDTYVLLHHFIKRTRKTPKKEIIKAIKERDDYVRRNK